MTANDADVELQCKKQMGYIKIKKRDKQDEAPREAN